VTRPKARRRKGEEKDNGRITLELAKRSVKKTERKCLLAEETRSGDWDVAWNMLETGMKETLEGRRSLRSHKIAEAAISKLPSKGKESSQKTDERSSGEDVGPIRFQREKGDRLNTQGKQKEERRVNSSRVDQLRCPKVSTI